MLDKDYVSDLLNQGVETEAQRQMSACLQQIFEEVDPLNTIVVSKELIDYIRDRLLSSLATLRRAATADVRSSMSPDAISQATGLSRATVSRLITEHRAA
jgi:primosomal protein N''